MLDPLAKEIKFFDGQYATKEEAQEHYQYNLFTRAAVFKNKDGKYSIAYIRDVVSETPHETAKAVKSTLGIDMVSFTSPLVGTWTDYKNPEEQLREVLSNLTESQEQDAGLTDLEREGITQEIIDQVVLGVGFSPVIPKRWGKPHNVYESAKKGYYVVEGIGAVTEDELKVMRARYLLNRNS